MKNIRHYFIINPNSGRKKETARNRANIEKVCTEKRVTYTVYETKCKNDGGEYLHRVVEEYLNENRGKDDFCDILRFYFCGGDGFVYEAANAFMTLPESARKGLVEIAAIPVGTGNDFIRNFGKEKDFLNIEKQLEGKPVLVDVMTFNDRYAANMFNIGFDCQVVKKVESLRGKFFMFKSIAYIIGLVITLVRYPHGEFTMTFDDDEKHSGRFLLTFIANGCYCGGGFKSASKAFTDDGILDVMIVNPISRLKFIRMVGSYKNGTLLDGDGYKSFSYFRKCKSVTLENPDGIDVCIDGEIERFTKVTMGVINKALIFSVPSNE